MQQLRGPAHPICHRRCSQHSGSPGIPGHRLLLGRAGHGWEFVYRLPRLAWLGPLAVSPAVPSLPPVVIASPALCWGFLCSPLWGVLLLPTSLLPPHSHAGSRVAPTGTNFWLIHPLWCSPHPWSGLRADPLTARSHPWKPRSLGQGPTAHLPTHSPETTRSWGSALPPLPLSLISRSHPAVLLAHLSLQPGVSRTSAWCASGETPSSLRVGNSLRAGGPSPHTQTPSSVPTSSQGYSFRGFR